MRLDNRPRESWTGFLIRCALLLAAVSATLGVGHSEAEASFPNPEGTPRRELVLQTGHTTPMNAVAFSPDAKWLASGGSDNQIKLWCISSGRELRSLNGHTGWVKSLG